MTGAGSTERAWPTRPGREATSRLAQRLMALATLVLLVAAFGLASRAFLSVNDGLTVLPQASIIGVSASA